VFTKKLLTAFTAFIFILFGTIAYAHGKNREAAAFFFMEKNAVNISQVIAGVEKEENGRVVLFKIKRDEDNPLQYEMKILKDGKAFEAKVDPKSGKVLKTESEGLFSYFSDDREKTSSNAKLSLKDAISIVEKQYGGKALGGDFERNSGMEMFRIRVANTEGAFTVMVDANTGELFRVSSNNGRNHDDEESEE
jgi:uncharacterized membrane protein YkoI